MTKKLATSRRLAAEISTQRDVKACRALSGIIPRRNPREIRQASLMSFNRSSIMRKYHHVQVPKALLLKDAVAAFARFQINVTKDVSHDSIWLVRRLYFLLYSFATRYFDISSKPMTRWRFPEMRSGARNALNAAF